ncbi:hypothetical protein DFS34DRAFT_618498 [Phlyctochytrium arcticum]|nr:hypothetical protein DFS34DRAFT_618498 [Phlyctochytrium arcticum]
MSRTLSSPLLLLLLLAIGAVFLAGPIQASPLDIFRRAECDAPKPRTCTFYTDCLEAKFQCGNKGYPLGYGFKYCSAFDANKDKFTPQGQEWMYNVMHCLQTKLVPDVQNDNSKCDSIKKHAFDTHSDCYVAEGFCKLPIKDWKTLLTIVELKDILTPLSFRETLQTAGQCAKEILKLLVNPN